MDSFAKAIISLCESEQQKQQWNDFLETLAQVVRVPLVKKVITHPELSSTQRASLLSDIIAKTPQQQALLSLLCKEKLLQKARALLNSYKRIWNDSSDVRPGVIRSDKKLGSDIHETIQARISNHLGKKVQLHWQQDSTILGVEATVGNYKYSLTISDIIQKINQELLRG